LCLPIGNGLTGLTYEEVLAVHKKRVEDLKREFDEFVEKLEQERLRRQKEIEEEYSKYVDDKEAWENFLNENEYVYDNEYDDEEWDEGDNLQEGKYIFIF
jgi:hypothetical protein